MKGKTVSTITKISRRIPVLCISQCGELALIIGEQVDAEAMGLDRQMHPDEAIIQVSLENLETSLKIAKAKRFNV